MKDSIWNHNPAKFVKECKRLRALSKRIIDGEESIIEGSRNMVGYMFRMKENKNDLWKIFRAVDTKSHHLPIGPVRQYWEQNALEKKDKEIKQLEDFYRNDVVAAARQIRDEYLKYIKPPEA